MEEVEKRVLSRLRPQLVKEMVVTESFLSAFCQSDLLEEHLAAGIRAESNFEKRATKLLETLPSLNTRAFFTLMEILEITNPWLSEKMKATLHDERTKDAKINIHPSMAKSAAIEGFAHSRLHIDPDIKERSSKFVRTNLYHLTEAEQRGVEKWMADELQRERRRQQFRAPLESRRQRGEFHSSKETQTDTCTLDLREMFDELAIYLHGVDYDEQEDKLSFGLIQHEVKELLTRTKNLDNLFLNCWNKFDDTDKYSQSLPDLIDRLVHQQKRLTTTEELNKQVINKMKDERDSLKRRIRRLEDDVEGLLKRQSNVIPPQELQLRHRQNVHMRYTFPYPADSNLMEDNDETKRHHPETSHVSEESKPQTTTSPPSTDKHPGQNTAHQYGSGPDKAARNGTNTAKSKPQDATQNNHANGAWGHIYRAEPIHFEERTIPLSNGHPEEQTHTYGLADGQRNYNNQNKNTVKHGSSDRESDRGRTGKDSGNTKKTGQLNEKHDDGTVPKLRRHASEESLRIAGSREELNSTSTSSLNSDIQPRQLSVEDLPSAVAQQSKYTVTNQQNRITRIDLHSRMQRLIASRCHNVKDFKAGESGPASDSTNAPTGQVPNSPNKSGRPMNSRDSSPSTNATTGQISNSPNKSAGRPMNSRDSSPSTNGKNILQNSYEMVHNSKTRDKSPSVAQNKPYGSGKNQTAVQNRTSDQKQPDEIQEKQGLFLLANRYNGAAALDNVKRQQVERYVQLGHPYRSFSSERLSRGAEKGQSPLRSKLNIVPNNMSIHGTHQHTGEYSSDSELVLKPSNLRERTARSSKPRSRSVRFANPIARTTNPNRTRVQRNSHYQMDTTSTVQKKIQK